jgi:serine/threonine protein kinase
LRTTIVQAFARTVVDESRNGAKQTAVGGRGTEGFPRASMPPPSVVALPGVGDVVGGHYQLVSLLGQGMFGKVYVAQRLDVPEHRVALKLLPRSLYAGRNVERELVMLATVGHPHVVQLKDHGTTPDYVWLTMPVYHGQTLAERLEKGTLGPRQACDIFLPIARGLEALHAAGLRHQDVKPENIFLAEFGGRVHPILLDLGVAAEKDASFVAGTALYGAPEQVAALAGLPAPAEMSEKMDTYGLAATLLYALVGPKHFPGEEATDRSGLTEAQELRTTEPLGPGALPEVTGKARDELAEAFKRWLAFDPAARPTMRELCEQLDVLLEPEREEERLEERRRARQKATITRLWVAFGMTLLAGGAFGVVAWQKRETLRVAAALDEARREGAASFDKLDTCIASHQVATKEVAACKAALELERVELKRSLEEVMRTGSTTEAEHAREVQRYNGRIKACEDAAAAAKRADDQELTRCVSDAARERAELGAERDAARRLSDQEKAERAAAEAERDACKAERLSCVEERDSCKSSLRAATAVAASPGNAPAQHAPASGAGTAAPATSAAPVAEPALPPPEPRPAAPPPVPPPPQQPAQAAPPEPKVAPAPKAAEEPKGT